MERKKTGQQHKKRENAALMPEIRAERRDHAVVVVKYIYTNTLHSFMRCNASGV